MSDLAVFKRVRRQVRKRWFTRPALLGNESGVVDAGIGKVWVRFEAGTDVNGNTTYSPSTKVNAGYANYAVYAGARVWLQYDENDELEIKGPDTRDLTGAGIDSKILNSARPENAFVYLRNVWRLLSRPAGSPGEPSYLVYVNPLVYDDNYGDFNHYAGTPKQADKIDLSSYIPGANNHRIAVVWLDTVNNTYQVTASTTQAMSSDIDSTDYQECFSQRNAETIPIQAYLLQNDADSIDARDLMEDLRQFVNMPQALGFPTPVTKKQILRSGRTQYIGGVLTTVETLTIQGTLTTDSAPDPVQVWSDYVPESYTLNTGTLSAGTVTDTQVMYDGNTLDILEVTGVPGFDIEFNFTNIVRLPNFIVSRWQYDGSSTHFVTIDIYNYNTTNWDQVRVFSNSNAYYASLTMYTPVDNRSDYVDATGNAKIRFYHQTTGNAAHDIHIDYVGLTNGVHL